MLIRSNKVGNTVRMLKIFFFLLFACYNMMAFSRTMSKDTLEENSQPPNCRPCQKKGKLNLFDRASHRLHQIWDEGRNELYIPAYAWHNRYTYSSERIHTYNENPWGGGLGKGFYDEDDDWHALYAFAFLDSHKNVEPIVGYAFMKAFHPKPDLVFGGGYALLATMRPDINHGIPFPGVLPWVSATYQRVSLVATYIPGHQNVGNVLFLIAKITL